MINWIFGIWGLIGAIFCGSALMSEDCGWGKKENGGWFWNLTIAFFFWPFLLVFGLIGCLLLWVLMYIKENHYYLFMWIANLFR